MLGYAGALLIFAGGTLAGLAASGMYRLRAAQLEAFCKLIAHIRAQIECYRAPLDAIYIGYRNEVLEACGFLGAARTSDGARALEACRGRLYITGDELCELEKFFASLGRHGAGEETSHCAYFEKRIGDFAAACRGELPKRARLCRTFGMLGGFLLAILLL
ncbi:MAG: stage III sporulation protein AB [Clostridia bacterium]|nr:stage III sporulation protein AB [Clostridia bacterium]